MRRQEDSPSILSQLFLGPLVFVGMTVVFGGLNGAALMLLWSWFVHPSFPELPLLVWWQAAGLMLTFRFATAHPDTREKEKKEYLNEDQWDKTFRLLREIWMIIGPRILIPLGTIVSGGIIHLLLWTK